MAALFLILGFSRIIIKITQFKKMKLSKEEADKMKKLPSAARSTFSKLADFNPPDSPEQKKEEDDDPNGPNKFDQLMKAACSIKSHQLEQQRKKFELLPSFLKAGVYYT